MKIPGVPDVNGLTDGLAEAADMWGKLLYVWNRRQVKLACLREAQLTLEHSSSATVLDVADQYWKFIIEGENSE